MNRGHDNPTGACLDAETLAAWADDGLLPQERRLAEAHLAGCSRCRLMLATLGRTEPDVVVAAADPAEEVLPWWKRGWNLGWLVPLTAAAAAFGLWMVLPVDPTLPTEVSQQAAAPEPSAPALSDRLTPAPPAAAPLPPARADSASPPAAESIREVEAAKTQPQAGAAAAAVEERQSFAAAPPQEPSPAADASADLAAARSDTRARAEQAAGVAAPPQPPAPSPANAGAGAAAAAPAPAAAQQRVLLNRLAPTITIQSPDGSSRWRVTAERIEHSADGGVTWAVQRDEPATISSGDAPTPQVCWLVGPGGVVLITTDGRTWQERQTPLPVDLAGVDATDARRATVVTRDGRRFSTTDGGVSWSDTSLQGF